MADAYYIRVRGQVKGPLSREQIVSQIRKKRLGRHHELSEDAVHWERAGDIPGLFESKFSASEEPVVAAATAVDSGVGGSQPAVEENSDAGWYYAKGRNNIGPVTAAEIKSMLATSRLQGSDRVWHGSLEDWTPAQDLPQFMGSVADAGASPVGDRRQTQQKAVIPKATFLEVLMGTSKGASLPDDAIYKYPSLTRYLLVAEGACRIMFVLLSLAVTSGFMVLVGQEVQNRFNDIAIILGVVLIAGIALVLQMVMLWLLFISCLAALEVVRVLIKIENNTSRPATSE
ncbi:MAG: GYF domain-containing protein [Planctomycetaceae bacterium]